MKQNIFIRPTSGLHSNAKKQWFTSYANGGLQRSCYIAKNKQDAINYAKIHTKSHNSKDVAVDFVWAEDYKNKPLVFSIGNVLVVNTIEIKEEA